MMQLRARNICTTIITLPLRIYIPRVANSTQFSTRDKIHINRPAGRRPIKLQGWQEAPGCTYTTSKSSQLSRTAFVGMMATQAERLVGSMWKSMLVMHEPA
jgi:hypothetical protein